MSTQVYAVTGVVFLIEQEMVIETTKKYVKEGNLEKLKLMYQNDSEILNFKIDDFENGDIEPDYLEELRNRNDAIRRLDQEEGYINYFLIDDDGKVNFMAPIDPEYCIYYIGIPYNFHLFKPMFDSWEEIYENVKEQLKWLPDDYDIKKNIAILDSVEFC